MPRDWSEEEPEPPKKLSVARPLIGMCVCICLVVVSVMLGYLAICGPGRGWNAGGTAPSRLEITAAIVLFWGSIVSGFGCFVWFVIRMIKNAYRNE
jgi:uncharacterized RDD family membrane protein YckC